MANFLYNIGKGRWAELFNRVDSNDPANSVLILVAINTTATDATLKDLTTMTAVEADANTAEVTNSGYARKVFTDSDIATYSVDNSGDKVTVTLSDQTWTAVATSPGAWTDLVLCYCADSTGGTTTANNANIIPLFQWDFAVTPDGNDIVADFGTTVAEAS